MSCPLPEALLALTLCACGAHNPEVVGEPAAASASAAQEPVMPVVVRVALVQGEAVPVATTGVFATLSASERLLIDDEGGRREVSTADLLLTEGDARVALTVEPGPFEALGRAWVLHGEAGSLELSLVPPGMRVKP